MSADQIRKLIRAQPFQPFVIHLADGRQILVRHPEFLEIAPGGRKITIHQPDESKEIVEMAMVTDLEVPAR